MKLLIALAALLFIPMEAEASKLVNQDMRQYFPSFGIGSTQSVAFTTSQGSTAQILSPNGSATELVQILVSAPAFVTEGANPSAVPTDMFVPANTAVILEVLAGDKVSAKAASSSGGSLFVTHLITFPKSN